MQKKWYRSRTDRMIGGVAAGIAEYFDIDPAIVRILFVVGLFFGAGILAYILLWIIIPEEPYIINSDDVNSTNSNTEHDNNNEKNTDDTNAENINYSDRKRKSANIFGAILIVVGVILILKMFLRVAIFLPIVLVALGIILLVRARKD